MKHKQTKNQQYTMEMELEHGDGMPCRLDLTTHWYYVIEGACRRKNIIVEEISLGYR
jgi:hypothetical protein